jgi:hypothetical protein
VPAEERGARGPALHRPPASGAQPVASMMARTTLGRCPIGENATPTTALVALMVFLPTDRPGGLEPLKDTVPHLRCDRRSAPERFASSIRSLTISSISRRASSSSATPWAHGLPSSGARASFGLENFETPKGTSVFVLTSMPHRRGRSIFLL